MAYRVKINDKEQMPNLWNAESEALIAMLSLKISKIRNFDKFKLCTDLNFQLLKKRKKASNKINYSPTRFQRAILNQEGY